MNNALFINGSPHTHGSTSRIMKILAKQIENAYVSDWMNTYELNMKACIGCCQCRPDSECVLPEDDGHLLREKIATADLIIVGSPVYWGNITAPLKMLFDRNVTTFEHFLKGRPSPKLTGKKGIIIVTGGTGPDHYEQPNQGGGAIQAIKTVLESGGIRILGTLNMHSAWDFDTYRQEIEENIANIVKTL